MNFESMFLNTRIIPIKLLFKQANQYIRLILAHCNAIMPFYFLFLAFPFVKYI